MSEKREKAKRKSTSKKKINIKLVSLSLIAVITLSVVLLIGFMGFVLAQNYEVDESKLTMNEASTIYDKNGEEVAKLYLHNREYVSIEEMPELLPKAFVAIEDKRFYEHQGIDFRSISRALYRDILARSMVEGGSTITQQLSKNVFLSHEKKLMRKTEEVLIALKLEQRYPKDKILEMYLNYIYFGHGAYGVQAAAQVYFGKDVQDLELGEIAMLAALPKAPNTYSPLREGNEEKSEGRRLLVLQEMEEQGIITAEQREEASQPLVLNAQGTNSNNAALETYIDMLMDEAEEKYGLTRDDLHVGGYEIYTGLDVKAQEAMYEALNIKSEQSQELFPAPGAEHFVQGSMVILDQHTGALAAVMGGRDYVPRGLNRATSRARQPGSTFKPIATYAPAFELGWNPYDLVQDELVDYGGYMPRNYDNKYRGKTTIMEAVRYSYNAPAVWLLHEIGIDTGVNYAKALGFDVERKLGIALGDVGASPLEMASAYSSFANEGYQHEPYLIEEIHDRKGNIVAKHEPKNKQVFSAQTSWYMTKVLQSVVQQGLSSRAALNKHPVAGKTGTVQAPKGLKGVRDAWFVGYTPQYTAAVWIGFDHSDSQHEMPSSGGNHPARIFKYVMDKALADVPVEAFTRPQGVKDLEAPVRLEPIQDLAAYLTLQADLSLTVDLEFTPLEDERIGYHIYRTDGITGEKALIDNISKEQLIGGRKWSDRQITIGNYYLYEVVPVNLSSGEEGEASNKVEIMVDPSSSALRRGEDVEQDEVERWLEDQDFEFEEAEMEEGSEDEEFIPEDQESVSGRQEEDSSGMEEFPETIFEDDPLMQQNPSGTDGERD